MQDRFLSLFTRFAFAILVTSCSSCGGGEHGYVPPVVQEARKEQTRPWEDPETHLMWPVRDNGSDLNWEGAQQFCRTLKAGGYLDWTVPTIEQLENMHRAEENELGSAVKGISRLTGDYQWSSTKDGDNAAWVYKFHPGKRYSHALSDTGSHVLCVRGPVK